MSHVYEGPLATYNSLTDRNLSGYFSNTRMRRHLRKAGLVNKRGELVSENQYRLNMARKEHKKHVKDMLAQAIVHKTLDMERTRQVEIRRKLEEIAKIELVRRVKDKNQRSDSYLLPLLSPRAKLPPPPSPIPTPPPPEEEEEEEEEKSSRGRKGDEEILPYLSPRSSRSASRPGTANQQRYRPQSAPSGKRYDDDIVYVDEHGRQLSPQGREEFRTTKARPQDIDSKHLYALDSAALRKYALQLSRIEQESMSPYLYSPVPTPPRSHRGNRVGSRPQIRSRPRTAEPQRSSSPREKKSANSSEKGSERSYSVNSEHETSPRGTPSRSLRNGHPRRPLNRPRVVEGSLMLHRQEPAMMHQGEVQTLCEITMKYHGPNLTLPRDQYDPTQNVTIDQQHCGGNTLAVFRENLKPGDTFSFISRRHRGYPFSLSIFVDGRVDSRVSTCCEYKHAKGVKLGGKMGHFSLLKVEGATPCYKCKLTTKASPRSLKRPPKAQKQPEQLREEVIVVDRRHVQELSSEVNEEEDEHLEIPVEDESTQQKNKYDTYIEPCNASEDNNVSKKESPKQKEEVKDEVISPEEADEKYEDDFDDEEEEKKDEEKGGQEDSSPREICGEDGGEFEDDRAAVNQNGDKKENEEEMNGKDQNQKTTNKQVRFNEDVKRMGTPESSVSKPGLGNDEDDKAKMEDVKPEDMKDRNIIGAINNEDEGAMDTCDEVSEIETDLESPRKLKDIDISKETTDKKYIETNETKSDETIDTANRVLEPECKKPEKTEDNYYSDDFEGSSESTVMSDKCNDKKQNNEDGSVTQKDNSLVTNAESQRHGEYYDEAYACNGDKLSQHDENENACMSVDAHVKYDTISMKSFDDEKKYYVEEDSENEELKQGPLKTTYEDMNIIGPLATLLMKVRRKKREMQSKLLTESDSDQEGQKEISEGFGSSSSLEKESLGKLGSQTSLSSLPFENQPNGKKKLEPIMKDKKKRKKKNSVSSSVTDSGRLSSETNGRPRRLSDASIRSLDSHRSIEQAIEASQEVVKAVLESQKQMAISIRQVTESSKLVVNSSKEVLESSKQVNESSKQVNESSKQVNESSKQVVETSQQAISTAMHAIRSIQQAEKDFANVIKSPEAAEKVETTKDSNSQTCQVNLLSDENAKPESEEIVDNSNNANSTIISSSIDDTNSMKECFDEKKLEMKSSLEKEKYTELSKEDVDFHPDEDKIHSIGDTDFHLVISLLDKISDPDTPHNPTKSNLSELHKSNLFSVQDMDCLPQSDEINVSNEINDIFNDLEKEDMDHIDGEVHTTTEEMHIPTEFQYTDYRTYFDEMEKKSQFEGNATSKELSLSDAIRCSEENENAYNLSSPFARRQSESTDIFEKESMMAKQKRSQSMPETPKKREIEIIKPKTFVYITKDETLYTETVDVKVRETVTDEVGDFSFSAKSSTPRSSELKDKIEKSKPSEDSESSILVHKSSEDDVLFSDDQQDKISLDTSGEASLLVEELLQNILEPNGQKSKSVKNSVQSLQQNEDKGEHLLDISREAEMIVEQVLQKVKSGMEEACVEKSVKTISRNEDTISIDTTQEAEMIVDDVLRRVQFEEAGQYKEIENKMNPQKPITPRTDPDGQVTHCVPEERSIIKEHVAYTQCNSENLVKSSSDEYDDFSSKSFSADKDDLYSKPRPLKRQEGMQNLFEAVDKETIVETGNILAIEQNDEDVSLCTSEEASLIVKRVIEGMSNDEKRTTDKFLKDKLINNVETDCPDINQDKTLETTTNLILEATTQEQMALTPMDFKTEESMTNKSIEVSNNSEIDQHEMCEDSEVSNTPNIEPIPIEIEEVRAIECPVVDIEKTSSISTEKPRLIKAKSGALVVKYPEIENTTQKNEIDSLINEEMKALVESEEKVNAAKHLTEPCITVTESRRKDEASTTSKIRNDLNIDECPQESTGHNVNIEMKENKNTTENKDEPVTRTEQVVKKEKIKERRDSNVSASSSSESSDTDIKFYMNGEEVKYPKEYQNGKSTDGTPNILDIDGQIIDLDNLESLDRETYKKVMAVAYNIDVMSTISEEHSTKIPESVSSKSSRSSSRSSSPSNHSLTSDEEDADRNAVSHFVYEDRKTKVVGLPADEDNRTEKTETDKDSVSDIRKVAGYSDEEEYPDGEKYSKEQNAATKVTPERETHVTRRRSTSSSSASSSSSRSRSRSITPERLDQYNAASEERLAQSRSPHRSPSPPEKRKSPSPELKRKSPSPEPARRSPSPDRRSPSPVRRSSTSSASSTSSVHVSEPEEKESTTEKVLLAKSREVNSLPSPQKRAPITRKDSVPVEFNYTSYSESIADSDVGKPIAEEEPVRPVSPLPQEFDYRKKYENSSPTLTKSFRKGSTSSNSSSDGGKKQFPTSTTNARKDYSSESEDERKGKLKTSDVKNTKEEKSNSDSDSAAAKKRTISKSVSKEKSRSSDSDSETEKKHALRQKELMFSKTAKSSSSSSSGSSSESEKEKKVPTPPRKSPSPPAMTQSVRKSSSSSSSSSSSDSSGASETDTARSQGEKAKLSTLTEQNEEQQQKESVPVPPVEPLKEEKKTSSSSSSSSGSSSESESEKEESKPAVKPPSPPEQRKAEPLVTNEDKTPKPKVEETRSVTSSSGSSSSSSDSSETETDRSEKPPVAKVPSPPQEPKPQPAVIEKVDKKPEPVQESKKDESSGSEDSSSDSDSSSSDSESEDEKDKKQEEETNENQTNSAVGSSKKQADLPISESDTDKKISIFTSDTDGENMHGGNDPDEVEAGGIGGTSYLSRIGVKPGNPVEGSIIPMFEGKTDIDLNSVALSNEQVSEISKYLLEKDDIKTFSLRNANLDCDKFENIVKGLKTTRSNVQMVNLNLNKLNATSAKEIGELLVEKPTLQILLLHGNPLGDTGIKYITESLQDVHNAHLSHKDEENPPSYCQLQELDLGDTSMGDEGMEQVSTLLEANTSLKTLNLNGNTRITVAGWKRLGKALKRNTTLETLTLDFNKIGDDGVASLVSGLKDNQTLKVLELEEGSISDEGGRKLVELLKCNTTILDITVSPGNTISDKTRGEILNYLGLNKAAAQPKST